MSIPEWREFEKLVARIEEAAGPADVSVKSPDHIADLVSGKPREVDASIRYDVGTARVLITVECRKRKDPQDVTWVEQLITKRQNIGAALTIAVSWAGFSEEAEALARRGGVELRRLEDVDAADIQSWFTFTSVLHIFRRSRLTGEVEVRYLHKTGDIENADMQSTQERHGPSNEKIFATEKDGLMSLDDIWLLAQAQNNFYADVPVRGSRKMATIRLKPPKGSLAVSTTAGAREVEEIVLEVELWHEMEEVPLDGSYHRYSDSAGMEIRRTEFSTITLLNVDLDVALQEEKDSKEIRFEISAKLNAPHH